MMSRLNHTASIPTTYASGAALPRNPQGLLPAGCWPLPGGSRTLWIALKGLERFPKSSVIPLSWAYPVASWAHTRRGFVKAEEVEPSRSGKALDWIGQLYALESDLQSQGTLGAAKLEARALHRKPIVEAFFVWLEQELVESALLPTNPFTKAARDALERQAGLQVFLEDPDVPLDTNPLERALRVIPMGRKNWLFCWTELGARYVGQVQSLITTCVLHGVDPYTYLVDVLQRIAIHPQSRVEELTPRLWKQHFAETPLGSWIDS